MHNINNEPATGLTKLVRFKDLKAAGIVNNWVTLRHYIADCGFPPGIRISYNVRAWPLSQIENWLAIRSADTTKIVPRGPGRPRKQPAQQTAA